MLDAEREFQDNLSQLLMDEDVVEVVSFENSGVLTMNAGLVVRMANGNEFIVSIVQSVFAEDDDEEGF